MSKRQLSCQTCKKNFEVVLSRKNAKFCSNECRFNGQIKLQKVICAVCNKEFWRVPSYIKRTKKHKICCSFVCKGKYLEDKYLGGNNPSFKLKKNENYFEQIDSEDKAYILGWIASDGHIGKNYITIALHVKDIEILYKIRHLLEADSKIKYIKNTNMCRFTISSTKIVYDVCFALNLKPGDKTYSISFPKFNSEKLMWAYIRGHFDGDGSINIFNDSSLRCTIASIVPSFLQELGKYIAIPHKIYKKSIEWYALSGLTFLSKIYDDAEIYLDRKYNLYQKWKKYYHDRENRKKSKIQSSV